MRKAKIRVIRIGFLQSKTSKTSPGRTKWSRAALDRPYRLKKLRNSRAEADGQTDLISVISGDVEPAFNITQSTEEELMTNINNLRAEVNELKIKNQELSIKNSNYIKIIVS